MHIHINTDTYMSINIHIIQINTDTYTDINFIQICCVSSLYHYNQVLSLFWAGSGWCSGSAHSSRAEGHGFFWLDVRSLTYPISVGSLSLQMSTDWCFSNRNKRVGTLLIYIIITPWAQHGCPINWVWDLAVAYMDKCMACAIPIHQINKNNNNIPIYWKSWYTRWNKSLWKREHANNSKTEIDFHKLSNLVIHEQYLL